MFSKNDSAASFSVGVNNLATSAVSINSWTNSSPLIMGSASGTMVIPKDLTVDGELTVGGKNIKETLEKIEERLAILHPNPQLEMKYEELRRIRQAYMDLEADIIEKEKMWELLKK